jgi:hypothetical protein
VILHGCRVGAASFLGYRDQDVTSDVIQKGPPAQAWALPLPADLTMTLVSDDRLCEFLNRFSQIETSSRGGFLRSGCWAWCVFFHVCQTESHRGKQSMVSASPVA